MTTSRMLNALNGKPVDRPPVWMMRQAGRYLPEYRAVRSQVKDFIALCENPELVTEVTLQPIRRFSLDAAIIFSDILVIPHAMGVPLKFLEGEGPVLEPISTLEQIQALPDIEVESDLNYVFKAIKWVSDSLGSDTPLIGFCGSPWTVACYMVEGSGSKTFSKIKRWAYSDPQALKVLLEKLANNSAEYLKAQVKAGAQILQIFDTWGGILPQAAYLEFSLEYMKKILETLKRDPLTKHVPVILFSKGVDCLQEMVQAGCDGISLDWTQSLEMAKQSVAGRVALQGNLDPCYLYAPKSVIFQKVQEILSVFKQESKFIFNLGHGIYPDVPIEGVETMLEVIRGKI